MKILQKVLWGGGLLFWFTLYMLGFTHSFYHMLLITLFNRFYHHSGIMALNNLYCSDVPLRNCWLTHWRKLHTLIKWLKLTSLSVHRPTSTSTAVLTVSEWYYSTIYAKFCKGKLCYVLGSLTAQTYSRRLKYRQNMHSKKVIKMLHRPLVDAGKTLTDPLGEL